MKCVCYESCHSLLAPRERKRVAIIICLLFTHIHTIYLILSTLPRTNPFHDNLSFANCAIPCTVTIAVCAWIFSLVGNFNCDFISIDTTVGGNQYSLGFGMWLYQGWAYLVDSGTIYYAQTCYGYSGNASPDAKWKTAQAFSIISVVIGAVAMIGNCFALLGSSNPSKGYSLFAVAYLFCCLSQGLTLLFLQSNACQGNPIFDAELPTDTIFECNLAWGGKVSAVATAFWFLAACMEGCVGMIYKGGMDDEEQEAAALDDELKDAEAPKKGPLVTEGGNHEA